MIASTKTEVAINKYLGLFEKRPLTESQINYIQDSLSIKLPDDLKSIMSVFDGYYEMAHQSLFSFNPSVSNWNIIEKTLFYRKSDCMRPKKYIALREEGESFIALDTEVGSVIWCSLSDAYRLKDGDSLIDNPKIFSTFKDFFEYLVTEEEKERGYTPKTDTKNS